MDRGRWQKVKEIFQTLIALAPKDRDAFLKQSCRGNPSLRQEILSLLEADVDKVSFLEKPLFEAQRVMPRKPLPKGSRIGPYQVVEVIGRGGMGIVYRAVRADGQYEREVAVKLLGWDLDARDLSHRFEKEGQILANLIHPNIARFYEGGITEGGLPYHAMEYVEGEPIKDYFESRKLSFKQRLLLFQKICEAVHFIHQHLVVHRDLKPDNILITGEGEPKLLDFGIAKLLRAKNGGTSSETLTGQQLMTLEYASPEQIQGDAITTASDVYTLGVLLYELLTGRLPYRWNRDEPEALKRAILEETPEKPSRVVDLASKQLNTRLPRTAKRTVWGESSKKLGRYLSGDMDQIVLMALRKEPHRRYASAAQLGEDLDRSLNAYPVRARKDTTTYLAFKFIGRHRLGATAFAMGFLVSMGFLATILIHQNRLEQERDRTNAQWQRAERTVSFLTALFEIADPYQLTKANGGQVTIRRLLERTAGEARQNNWVAPEIKATFMELIGRAYGNLGFSQESLNLLEESLRLREKTGEYRHPQVGESHFHIGSAHLAMGQYLEAEDHLMLSLQLHLKLAGKNSASTAQSLVGLARLRVERDQFEKAELYLRQALEIQETLATGANLLELASSLDDLALTYYGRARYAESRMLFQRVITMRQTVLGEGHPAVMAVRDNLARIPSN